MPSLIIIFMLMEFPMIRNIIGNGHCRKFKQSKLGTLNQGIHQLWLESLILEPIWLTMPALLIQI